MKKKQLEEISGTKPDVLQALVITSDPQYPWTPKMDSGGANESDDEKQRVSERLIREQYQDINSYTNSVSNSSVIINGDITAYGHGWQRAKMADLLRTLNKPYYYGLGNHDIENNKDDCFQDMCFLSTMDDFISHISKVDSKDVQSKTGLRYTGSFAYAVEFGDIYSIQLNNDPTMETEGFGGRFRRSYKMVENLDWLEKQLKFAKKNEKIIIVNVHKPNDWKGGPSERFKKLLKEYGVAAVFCGHYHTECGKTSYYSDFFGDVPVFLSGSASQSTYLILENTGYSLDIYLVRDNNWKDRKLERSIIQEKNFGDRVHDGVYQIETSLDNRSVATLSENNGAIRDNLIKVYDKKKQPEQEWRLVYDEEKRAYQIKSMCNEDLVLAWIKDVPESRKVWAHVNEYREEHYWVLKKVSYGFSEGYIIQNRSNPRIVLDVDGANTNEGTEIKVNERHHLGANLTHIKAQIFNLKACKAKIPDDRYVIRTALNDRSVVERLSSGLALSDRPIHKDQRWNFVYNNKEDAYLIKSESNPEKVLTLGDLIFRKFLLVIDFDQKEEQYWIFLDVGDGYYVIMNKRYPEYVLDVDGANTNEGTKIKVHKRHHLGANERDKKAQTWKLERV